MQIRDEVPCRPGHGDGVAAASVAGVEERARAVVGADPGERGDPRQNRGRVGDRHAPDVSVVAVAGFKDDGGTTRAAAFEVELAAAADIDPTRYRPHGRLPQRGRGAGSGL